MQKTNIPLKGCQKKRKDKLNSYQQKIISHESNFKSQTLIYKVSLAFIELLRSVPLPVFKK